MKKPLSIMWYTMILLALFKVWLVEGQSVFAVPYATHDDRLFISLSQHLLNGQWLGPYDNLALSKVPFYSIWISISFLLGMPLLYSQHLLYIAACFVFIIAIMPLLNRPIYAIIFFGILLFNPMSYSDYVMTRVTREGIYPAQTLLVVACLLGLLARLGKDCRRLWIWFCGLGMGLAALWLTREEGIWILPLVGIVLAFSIIRIWVAKRGDWKMKLLLVGSSIAFSIILVATVSSLNHYHYGLFAPSEMSSRAFKSAYGALTRVKPAKWQPFVPVSRQTRGQIYEVSPAFAELKPYLEGSVGKFWGWIGPKNESNQDEILGGWFMWAFRDAVARAGYYSLGAFPAEYYQRLADEINTACSNHELDCLAKRSSLMPPWREQYLKPLLNNLYLVSQFMLEFQGFSARPSRSMGAGKPENIFRDLTKEEFRGDNQQLVITGWVFKEDEPIDLLISTYDESPVYAIIKFQPSEDIYNKFLRQGKDIPSAQRAKFKIQTPCLELCYLEIRAGDQLLQKIPLTGEANTLDKDGLHLSIRKVDTRVTLPDQYASNERKIGVLQKIGTLYRVITPYFSRLALAAFVYLGVDSLRKRTDLTRCVIAAAVLTVIFCRVILIALIEVTSFPAINTRYLSPAYPLLLLFVSLPLIWVCEDILTARSSRRRKESNQEL